MRPALARRSLLREFAVATCLALAAHSALAIESGGDLQRSMDELRLRNQQQTTELRRQELRQRWLWVLLGGSSAVLGGATVYLFRLRRSVRLQAANHAQLERSRSESRAGIRHELRTPLNAILGFAQMLEADASLTETQRRGVSSIRQSGQRLLTLIDHYADPAGNPAAAYLDAYVIKEGAHIESPDPVESIAQEDTAVPPQHEIAVLHDLALAGSMREILERACWIESLDSRYAPFARQLAGLARAYESQAVLALIVRYRRAG